MNSFLLKAHLALLAVNTLYGAQYVIAKDVMPQYLEPSSFVMTRVIGALILFWLFNRLTGIDSIKTKDIPRFALCGLFGVAINQLFFYEGLSLTSSINASIIMTSTPVIVILLSVIFLKERITYRRIGGICLGLSGAVGIILLGSDKKLGVNQLGDTFILINAMSYSMYLILVKPLMLKYSPITVVSYVFIFGNAVVIPYAFSSFTEQNWDMPGKIYLEIVYVIAGVTFLAYLLNAFALKVVSPTVTSSYIYLQPVFAFLFALLYDHITNGNMVGEPGIWHLVFALFIFTGVYLVSKRTT